MTQTCITSCSAAYRFVGLEYEMAIEEIEDLSQMELEIMKKTEVQNEKPV